RLQRNSRHNQKVGDAMIVPSTTLANVAVRDRSNAVTKGKSQDTVAIEYSCNECGDEFEIFRDLAKHKRAAQCKGDEIDDVWTEEMFEKSPSSNKHIFKENCNLKERKRDSHEEMLYECTICEKSFGIISDLSNHMSAAHQDVKPHKCDQCDKSETFNFEKCGKAFRHKPNLLRHLRKYHKAKPFNCKICGAHFEGISDLNQHVKAIHKEIKTRKSNEKAHQCNQCEKHFRVAADLKSERPFKCDKCDSSFGRTSYLRRLLRLSHKAKPFQCKLCGAAFAKHKEFALHKITAHKGSRFYSKVAKRVEKFSRHSV
ncbi:hypothetical protein PRIPAC_82938, partial [Pristionchus pacificus]|uniref:Zinc finger protein n=1 Tax=Pristionchus pacificus TaxID=54126 RepID=A0A2A6BV40_PRIPA